MPPTERPPVIRTVELSDTEWATERDTIAHRFFGVDATQFVTRYQAGDYDNDAAIDAGLSTVLGFFPELD